MLNSVGSSAVTAWLSSSTMKSEESSVSSSERLSPLVGLAPLKGFKRACGSSSLSSLSSLGSGDCVGPPVLFPDGKTVSTGD